MNTIIFIAILSILIFVHELGHFLMARRQGIRVEKFSLGFGPKLFGFVYKEVNFKVCLIPFGGYVKMAGDDRKQCKGEQWEYFSKTPGQRAKVVFCGPLFNYILSILFLWIVYCVGYPQWSPIVGEVLEGKPAYEAGIQENDEIIEINGNKIKYWEDVTANIKDKVIEGEINIRVVREEEELEFSIIPEQKESTDLFGKKRQVSVIGIVASGDLTKERYNIFVAFGKSLIKVFQMTCMTFKAIISLIVGHLALKEAVTGPIGIFHITSEAAKYGFDALLHVTSMLSLALAIFNVLPIPVLDGGHLLFLAIEKIRKRPLSEKVEGRITDIGFGFIIILAVFILINDLIRFNYWDKINDWLLQWHSK